MFLYCYYYYNYHNILMNYTYNHHDDKKLIFMINSMDTVML